MRSLIDIDYRSIIFLVLAKERDEKENNKGWKVWIDSVRFATRTADLLASYAHVEDSFMGVSVSAGRSSIIRDTQSSSVVRVLISPDLPDLLQPRIKPFMAL